jgi:hypothetical protein
VSAVIGAATSAGLANGSTSTTFSFVSTNQPLYVVVSWWNGSSSAITGITFNGVALTRVAQSALSNGSDRAEIWRLLTPAATTANIVVSFGGSQCAGAAVAFNTTGQDTGGTPEGTAATNASSVNGASTGNLSIAPAAGDATIVVMANGNGAAVTFTFTGGTGGTELYDQANNGDRTGVAKVSDAATVVSVSWTGSTSWVIAAIPLKAAAAQDTPELYGRPMGARGAGQMQQLLAQ